MTSYPVRVIINVTDFAGKSGKEQKFMVIKIAFTIYSAFVLICLLLYIPKLRQLFYARHRIEHKIAAEKRRISVIVPARDESEIIGDLFSSIAGQDYDSGFFSVNVIVNSEDDPTVQMARSRGYKVFVVPDQKCKGDALDGYFKAESKQALSSFDAFVIADADAVFTHDYLRELNNALEYGADIFLSRKHVKNFYGERRDRTIFTNCSALTYAQLDDLGNIYRTDHDIPLNMCGQGMMVRREVIEKLGGWPYRTLTEDYEMKMDCYLKGFKSLYYPYAVICTEEPLKHSENFHRRMRWVTGFSQSDAIYKKRIKEQVKKRGRMTAGEREYFYGTVPPIIYFVLTLLTVLFGAGMSVYGGVTGAFGWLRPLLALVVVPLATLYLFLLVYAIMCIASMKDAFANVPLGEKIATVLFEPFFALEYVPIFIASKFKAHHSGYWKPTRHIRYKGGLHGRARAHKLNTAVENNVIEGGEPVEEVNG